MKNPLPVQISTSAVPAHLLPGWSPFLTERRGASRHWQILVQHLVVDWNSLINSSARALTWLASAQDSCHPCRYERQQQKDFAMDISPAAIVSASTQIKQSQVAQEAQLLVLKKAMDIQATGALALLQSLPLATSGNLGTQINTLA